MDKSILDMVHETAQDLRAAGVVILPKNNRVDKWNFVT